MKTSEVVDQVASERARVLALLREVAKSSRKFAKGARERQAINAMETVLVVLSRSPARVRERPTQRRAQA